jgi:CHAT domain-containing protein
MKIAVAFQWGLIAALTLPARGAPPQNAPGNAAGVRPASTLALHQPIEREMGPGLTDVFTVEAAGGQFLHLVVEKEGVNVVATLADPEGRSLMTADDPAYRAYGSEAVSAIASAAGTYQIHISKSPRTAESGRYRIELTSLGSLTDEDRTRLQAETKFYAAVLNERSESKQNRLKAIEGYQQAADLWRTLHDDGQTALCQYRVGAVHRYLGEFPEALAAFRRALPLWEAAGDRSGEAVTLTAMGSLEADTGKTEQVLSAYDKALSLEREAGDRESEALTLQLIGIYRYNAGDEKVALESYEQALALRQTLGDQQNEANLLVAIGLSYQALGENQKALASLEQALPLSRAINDPGGEASVLNNIGFVYRELGDYSKALEYSNQALPIYRAIGDRNGETLLLYGIGLTYAWLGENQKALDYGNQALPQAQAGGDRRTESLVLSLIGTAYAGLHQWQNALSYNNQSLVLNRAVGDRSDEAWTVLAIGDACSHLGQKQEALRNYLEAFEMARTDSNPSQEAAVSGDLMAYWRGEKNPALAIFFGKQAVNFLQQMRSNLQGADEGVQKSFLTSNESYYRDLARLLIDQGRLPEAQQVLDLLKQQEYTDYVRGDPSKMLGSLSLTPAEQLAEQDYEKSTEHLVAISQQWSQLRTMASRTPEQEQQYQQLSKDLENANEGLNAYYARLYKLFEQGSGANRQVADVKGEAAELRGEIAQMPRTVALYTVLTQDQYSVLVMTGAAMVARNYVIDAKMLNEKVAAFEEVLRNPERDPRPLAQDLYGILVGPIRRDLDQAQAQTLIWSLDGVLRYVPMGALFDGQHYLVEDYNLVSISPASIPHLGDQPSLEKVSALAMGISRKYEDSLNPLPSVVVELDDIVRDPQVPGANGVLPGTILLDGNFTERAMEDQLNGQHAIVHIASHFVFSPGDDNASYLLLAGKDSASAGYHLTVADFRDNPNLSLADTALLTLSACDTGVGSNAGNGREVDGLAMTAQLKGARAVISSLWSVNDASTGVLMADFYQRWAEGAGKVMKIEALREAQLDLLHGKVKPQAVTSGRGITVVGNEPRKPGGETSYAHPYYWAPFVLTGNWK